MKLPSLSRFTIYFWLTALLCIIETLCYTYLRKYEDLRTFNAVLYFICGLGICVFSLLAAVRAVKKNELPVKAGSSLQLIKYLCLLAFFVFVCFLFIDFGNSTFALHPINYHEADMLPLIKIACERLIHGQEIYKPVKEVWGGEWIPYLPAMWGPYLPTVVLGVDIRWTSIVLSILCVAGILFYLSRLNSRVSVSLTVVIFLMTFLLVKYYTWEDESFYRFTEEAVPAFFYFILFFALMYEWTWLTGIAIALCILSRFSILSFLPFFLVWLLLNKDFKSIIKIGVSCFLVMLVTFIIPFFIRDPLFFLGIPGRYAANLETVWRANDYDLKGISTLGLAYVFGYPHLRLMIVLSWVLQLAVPCVWLALFFFLNKRYVINKGLWAMAGLKLSLLIFYNFIGMPYIYLFIVPTLISYPLLLAVGREAEY